MRLIDADELNEYIGRESLDTREKIFALVDRMPTIEPRPHGEWQNERFSESHALYFGKCSQCGKTGVTGDFCMCCGADMRKNGEKK